MKNTDIPSILFADEYEDLYKELRELMEVSKLNDPLRTFNSSLPSNQIMKEMAEAYKPEYLDENSREYLTANFWWIYLGFAILQGKRESVKDNKYIDTSVNRRKLIKRVTNQLNYVPAGNALKKFYNLPEKFDGICNVIDKDIKNLILK